MALLFERFPVPFRGGFPIFPPVQSPCPRKSWICLQSLHPRRFEVFNQSLYLVLKNYRTLYIVLINSSCKGQTLWFKRMEWYVLNPHYKKSPSINSLGFHEKSNDVNVSKQELYWSVYFKYVRSILYITIP